MGSERFRIFGDGLGKKEWGQYFRRDWYPGGHYDSTTRIFCELWQRIDRAIVFLLKQLRVREGGWTCYQFLKVGCWERGCDLFKGDVAVFTFFEGDVDTHCTLWVFHNQGDFLRSRKHKQACFSCFWYWDVQFISCFHRKLLPTVSHCNGISSTW